MGESAEQTCVFCRIASGELPATIVYDDADLVGFKDLNPQAPQHTLVIPRKHVGSMDELDDGDADLIARLVLAARDIARRQGIADTGYRLVTNVGVEGGQSVAHLHLHLLGGRPLGWPPG